ncbi:MAG: FtsH protease activity modulator HflK [Alphaproteobacteria bacterium]|nr:FtsH protease activity modulator HflK [Alphaproteobacteria bacterium]
MPWQNQGGGGGPWGSGGGGGGSPWGRGGGGGGMQPPDLEDLIRRGQDRFKKMMPGGTASPRAISLIVLVAILVWGMTGFYRVNPDEQGVAMTFGKWVETTQPGLRWNWPAPIGSIERPKVTRQNRVEVGFTTNAPQSRAGGKRDVASESLMLTGDENIIDIQFVVFWVIKDAGQYLFNIRNPDSTVKSAAEAAMREIVGKNNFEFARTQGRGRIQEDSKKLIQHILDTYGSGVLVTQVEIQKVDPPAKVIDAFRDVQAARADKERAVNEAQAYFNEQTQRAEGEAERVVREAEGIKEARIAESTGASQRFLSVYEQYKGAKDITMRRMYLETMEDILAGMDKVIVDPSGSGAGVIPYLPLQELTTKRRPGQGGAQ